MRTEMVSARVASVSDRKWPVVQELVLCENDPRVVADARSDGTVSVWQPADGHSVTISWEALQRLYWAAFDARRLLPYKPTHENCDCWMCSEKLQSQAPGEFSNLVGENPITKHHIEAAFAMLDRKKGEWPR